MLAGFPFVSSLLSSIKGSCSWIITTSVANLCNICTAIAIVCVVMTNISLSVHVYEKCSLDKNVRRVPASGDHSDYSHLDVDCSSYSQTELDYFGYLSSNRGLATALVTVYGAACIVLNGVSMVYSFFLARRCRMQHPNWLTAPVNFSSGKKMSTRSISTAAGFV
jgi:hypothetical protein